MVELSTICKRGFIAPLEIKVNNVSTQFNHLSSDFHLSTLYLLFYEYFLYIIV
jgi:hypothetical protein